MLLKCIWQIFLIARLNLPIVLISITKIFFDIDFPSSVLMYQKQQISLPMGYKTARQKRGHWEWLWRHFSTPSFAKNRFLRHFLYCELINSLRNGAIDYSVLLIRKCWRNLFFAKLGVLKWHHNRSQSPVFGLAVLYPTGSEIWRFWYIKTRGRKIAIEKFFAIN